jgi:hypothetical protein
LQFTFRYDPQGITVLKTEEVSGESIPADQFPNLEEEEDPERLLEGLITVTGDQEQITRAEIERPVFR